LKKACSVTDSVKDDVTDTDDATDTDENNS
jgi:hypothetical protein